MAGTIREAIAELRVELSELRAEVSRDSRRIAALERAPKRASKPERKVAEPRKAVRVVADGVCQKHTKKHLKAMKPANRAFHLGWCTLSHR